MTFRVRNKKSKILFDGSSNGISNWNVFKDPKGTKKIEVKIERPAPRMDVMDKKPKKKLRIRKKREVSLLRSSPSRPRRDSGDSSDDGSRPGPASSAADLRSPRRRAPTVPGLNVSPPPPSDTPNRMRQRRRSGRPLGQRQLRCRNLGCPDTGVTFSTEGNRRRHEQETCSTRVQVLIKSVFYYWYSDLYIPGRSMVGANTCCTEPQCDRVQGPRLSGPLSDFAESTSP